ncbi:MAG TPA: succinyl-diaminopimelate desuccinylase [Candidatus Megaira endosymbiont of Hartmannula sinica]|nr:succinyl-diaminopimelate desuccinylase [Candidatus Megaera endosymbiont of Hartmannula sinica]
MGYQKQIDNILEQLISYKSISPKDCGSIDYIACFLQKIGFSVITKEFGNNEEKTNNLYAYLRYNDVNKNSKVKDNCNYTEKYDNLCFSGHIDVVDPVDTSKWINQNPFKLYIDNNNKYYGRGVVDMKGAVAVMLISVKNFLEKQKLLTDNINKDNITKNSKYLSFLITSDEEGKALNGTKKMLEYIYSNKEIPKPSICINGEPTSDQYIGDIIKIGRRGSMHVDIDITGVAGHVAYHQKALNPIDISALIITELKKIKFDKGDKYFDPSNLEFTKIEVKNHSSNVIPIQAKIRANIRYNNIENKESKKYISKEDYIVNIIKDKIDYIIQENSNLKDKDSSNQYSYKINFINSSKPFFQEKTDRMSFYINAINSIFPTKISCSGGTSDARFIYKYCPVIELGLKFHTAHKINEHTENIDLQNLYKVYYELVNRHFDG